MGDRRPPNPNKPSDEQAAIRDCKDRIVIGNAFAGTGKTSTAVFYADARPEAKILYLAFNAPIVKEASAKFGPNVVVKTGHSLAWAETPTWMQKRIARPWRVGQFQDEMRLDSPRMARLGMIALKNFLISDNENIPDAQLDDQDMYSMGPSPHELREATSIAKIAWGRMNNPDDTISLPDDAYFKRWALSKPQLRYDHIILDEAQDTNPVTFGLVKSQQRASVLYLGDRHQSIYRFRGAENAMEKIAHLGTSLYLSKTFRFGPAIADYANTILGDLKGETVKITGLGKDKKYGPGQEAFLARTNGMLLRSAAARQGKGIFWVGEGGAKNYRIEDCMDAYHLWNRNRTSIKSASIRRFSSFTHLVNDANESADKEMLFLSGLVEEHQDELPGLLQQIEKNQVLRIEDADFIYTTAHKSKGLDWNQVRLADDFDLLEDVENHLKDGVPITPELIQEINLLYVACTRAKHCIEFDKKTVTWLANLDQHRAARAENRKRVMRSTPG